MRLARLTHHASRFTLYASLCAVIAALLASASVALAQVSANYDLSWHVIAGGGGQMQSGGYTLMDTVGQPAIGAMTSGGHALCSGFWCGVLPGYRIYLPLVLRNH